jgi:hypothetical protein
MVRSLVCLAAENVVRDATSNSISVFNILEGVSGNGFPLLVQRTAFLTVWERERVDPQDYAGRFAVSLGGTELIARNVSVNFRDKLRNRSILTVNGLVIPQPGTLVFSLTISSDVVARYAVEVSATILATDEAEVDAIPTEAPPSDGGA